MQSGYTHTFTSLEPTTLRRLADLFGRDCSVIQRHGIARVRFSSEDEYHLFMQQVWGRINSTEHASATNSPELPRPGP